MSRLSTWPTKSLKVLIKELFCSHCQAETQPFRNFFCHEQGIIASVPIIRHTVATQKVQFSRWFWRCMYMENARNSFFSVLFSQDKAIYVLEKAKRFNSSHRRELDLFMLLLHIVCAFPVSNDSPARLETSKPLLSPKKT